MNFEEIIIQPVLTEKTNRFKEGEEKKYVFKVNKRANKIQIIEAINGLFSVKPKACNVLNVKSKPRTYRSKSGYRKGSTATWKKAIVTLKAGDKIDIFEGA